MTSPLPPPGPSRAVQARRLIATLLAVALALSACSWLSGDKKSEGDKLQSSVAEVARGLPTDPVAAIEQLVVEVHRAEPDRAQAAVAEILRRSGLPVVSSGGPVVALPDEVVLFDVPIYAELLPVLTDSVRAGDRYTVDQFITMLQVLKITAKPLAFGELAGAVAGWGKEPDDHPVFVSAGAAVRALGAARGELLHARADPQAVFLDPLQTLLLAAHGGSRFWKVKAGAKSSALGAPNTPGFIDRLVGGGVAHADEGPCKLLSSLLDSPNPLVKANAGFLKGELVDRLLGEVFKTRGMNPGKVFNEDNKELLGKATATLGILGTTISSIVLMLGARVDMTTDKAKTHFKHEAGTRGEHVKLTATARFDFKNSKKVMECYALAGLTIPEAGPLEGFTIRWSSSQPHVGTIQEGGNALLTAVSADSTKLTHGEKVGKDGKSTLELKPPVEVPARKGAELKGRAVFTAKLDKENFPWSLDDIWSLTRSGADASVEKDKLDAYGAAVVKAFELIAEMLTKAGLPSQSIAVDVEYHGTEVVLAKGSAPVELLLAKLPKVYVDLVSCSGVEGPYNGTGGFDGAEVNETYRQAWASTYGVSLPGKTAPQDAQIVPVKVNDKGLPEVFYIMKGEGGKRFLDGKITLYSEDRRDSPILANKIAYYDGWKVGHPVGEVEILLGGKSFTFADLTWPVVRVGEDPRCPKVEYKYDGL